MERIRRGFSLVTLSLMATVYLAMIGAMVVCFILLPLLVVMHLIGQWLK